MEGMVIMLIEKLDARYVHMKNAQLTLEKYTDGSLALVAEAEDEDGLPDRETFSVNLSGYDMHPPEGHVYIKDYAEHEGVPEALVNLGIIDVVKRIRFGMFGSGVLAKLSDSILFDREEAR